MTVTKNKNGTWRVDISSGFSHVDSSRNRTRKSGFKTKKEAEDYEAEYRLFGLQQIKVKDKIPIAFLWSECQKQDERMGNSQATKDTQTSYYKMYLSKYFAKADMKAIDIEDIQQFRDWLRQQKSIKGGKLSAGNVNRQMIFLHKLLDIAIKKRFRSDNPCSLIRALPESYKEMKFYTPAQFKQFIALFQPDEYAFKLLYEILMFTGARISEALALTWKSVNFDKGYIDIKSAAHYKHSKITIGKTKTTQSVRTIYIHKNFLNELSDWRKKQAEILGKFTQDCDELQIFQSSPKILTHPDVSNFQHDKLKKRLPESLPFIRNHDFRHSHAAFLISEGLRNGEGKDYLFFVLMKRLGHSSITTTINTYSHLFPDNQKEIANAFDNF